MRIAASAVQGLAFANGLPAIAVSSLACQAQTALRLGCVSAGDTALSVMDARINEIYWATCLVEDGVMVLYHGPVVGAPQSVFPEPCNKLVAVGGGTAYAALLPDSVVNTLSAMHLDILPSARDLLPLALKKLADGELQQASDVAPVYVREEVSWKKLAEQGKR